MDIKTIAVIGSGVMGSGIAAQIANAGLDVLLYDIVPDGADDRSIIARTAIAKLLKTDPAPLMHKRNAKRITPLNLDDDLQRLGECDVIIEVVLERLDIKHATYEKIIAHKRPDAIVTSNTSSIPLAELVAPFDRAFQEKFVITHFFNPPRYLRLLELVVGANSGESTIATMRDFCDQKLGKNVVVAKDTPGFIANRIGTFWLTKAVNTALDQNVPIEVADAVMSKPAGIPKTGVFGLLDLIGLDLMPHLSASLLERLPKDDGYAREYRDVPFITAMIEDGYTGRKGKGGFYRLNPDAPKGVREKQAIDLSDKTFAADQYRKADKPRLASVAAGKKGLRAVIDTDDQGGAYAREVLVATLGYAASLIPEIADTIVEADTAMRFGFNWKKGPFEMIDAIGPAWLAAQLGDGAPAFLTAVGDGTFYKVEDGQQLFFGTDGQYHPVERPEGVLLLADIKLASQPLTKTASAALWDIGDGALCLEFTGKMNALDDQVFSVIHKAVRMIGDGSGDHKALVVYNEGSHFSAGANLGLAIFAMNTALWPQIEELVRGGQQAYKALKFAPFPVVSAPSGMALGGGCEILLHSDHIQAHAETYCGLVEVGVGLIPGWGGCKEMLIRFREQERAAYAKAGGGERIWFSPDTTPMGAVRKAFEVIGTAQVAKSADEARSIGYMRHSDGITMNRDRLLYDAKQKALALVDGYTAPEPVMDFRLPGASGEVALDLAVSDLQKSGKATAYDGTVSSALAKVLSGGEKGDWTETLSEDELLSLEVEEFMILAKTPGTWDRVEHMLTTGKPLRN